MRRKEDELRFLGGIERAKDGKSLSTRRDQGQKLQLLLRRLLLSTLKIENFDACRFHSARSPPTSAVAESRVRRRRLASGDSPACRCRRRLRRSATADLLVDGGIADNVPIDVAAASAAR